jgi:uncharacterized Fe-S cluster-containing radical SAM superfamily protein
MAWIKTDDLSLSLRVRSVRCETHELLISRIDGSAQEQDLSEPPNCEGYGRIRHFHTHTPAPWPDNPLPMLPAAYRLGMPAAKLCNAQVFQNASCNWRCWYCFVPFNLLAADEAHASWLTPDQLVRLSLTEENRPLIVDCSGGQPDLVPEWVPWMMDALRKHGLAEQVYLWSDDNLSTDYFWRYLTAAERRAVARYSLYGRVCCFKGYNAESFAFNTKAAPDLFSRQFELFDRLLSLGIDLYAYATFTTPSVVGLEEDMRRFVDRLQDIHPNLPLRLVPLRIEAFGVVQPRIRLVHERAIAFQEDAVTAWNDEIGRRFSSSERLAPMPEVSLGS